MGSAPAMKLSYTMGYRKMSQNIKPLAHSTSSGTASNYTNVLGVKNVKPEISPQDTFWVRIELLYIH
jgi:hypothetical protein